MLKAHENVLFRKPQLFMPTKINNLTAYKKSTAAKSGYNVG